MAVPAQTKPQTAGNDATTNFNYPGGPLKPDAQQSFIGGTHNVSVKINPDTALAGGYTPIPGDTMPAGAPTDQDGSNNPYFPKN